jgi:hypothetical protein
VRKRDRNADEEGIYGGNALVDLRRHYQVDDDSKLALCRWNNL